MYTNYTSKSRSLQNTIPIGHELPSKLTASTVVHSRRILLYKLIATLKSHINGYTYVLQTKYIITEIIVIRRTYYVILFPVIILSWVFCILWAIKIKSNDIIRALRYAIIVLQYDDYKYFGISTTNAISIGLYLGSCMS